MTYKNIKCPKCNCENFNLVKSSVKNKLIVMCANCLSIAQESITYKTNESSYFRKFFSEEEQK
jgi:uncharacterized Zn finger protein